MKAETLYEAVTGGSPPSARTPDSNLSIFFSELVSKSLAPYFERHMAELSEVVCNFLYFFIFLFLKRARK